MIDSIITISNPPGKKAKRSIFCPLFSGNDYRQSLVLDLCINLYSRLKRDCLASQVGHKIHLEKFSSSYNECEELPFLASFSPKKTKSEDDSAANDADDNDDVAEVDPSGGGGNNDNKENEDEDDDEVQEVVD